MKTAIAAPDPKRPRRADVAYVVCSHALTLLETLATTKLILTEQNPAAKPYLDALVDDFAACARMTIHKMAAEGEADGGHE